MLTTINREQAKQLIDASEGRIFKAIFRKRTADEDGKRRFRRMVCRKGVKKGVTGKGMAYDPRTKGLISVFDMQKNAFRMISIDGLVSLKVDGIGYRVVKNHK